MASGQTVTCLCVYPRKMPLVDTVYTNYSFRGNSTKYAGLLTLKVLVTTIDAQWEGMGDVGSARYEPALLLPCPTIRVLSYSN